MDDIYEPGNEKVPVTVDGIEVVMARAAQLWDRAVMDNWSCTAN